VIEAGTFEISLQPSNSTRKFLQGTMSLSPKKRLENRLRGKILVVDDEPLALKAVLHMLKRFPCEILTADSASEALAVWSKEREHIEYVVLDIVLPGISGVELGKCLKHEKKSLTVVFMSGFSRSTLEVLGHHLPPGTSFLQKPFTEDELLQKLFGSRLVGSG
jgi:CheY-like chemotaxis protein